MAMGGSYHKGNSSTTAGSGSGSGSSRSPSSARPYGLMLLLAFGAAFLGVMLIHKFRERRLFGLLVKEKDQELMSLHFLLQKEKEYSKGMKTKMEEMKGKIYSLRTQKMELDRRVLEMQSTISSLKEEVKTMESALEEKQNEIKMLRETNTNQEREGDQLVALKESLKQKEAEIQDLKHRLEHPVKLWSRSTDDPSNQAMNVTVTAGSQDDNSSSEIANYGNVNSDNDHQTFENSLHHLAHEGASGKGIADTSQVNKNFQENSALRAKEETNTTNTDQLLNDAVERVSKTADSEGHNAEGDKNAEQERGHEDHEEAFKGGNGMKLETDDNIKGTSSWSKVKNVHETNRSRGKRWRMSTRNRKLGNNKNKQKISGTESARSRQNFSNEPDTKTKREEATKLQESHKLKDSDDPRNSKMEEHKNQRMGELPEDGKAGDDTRDGNKQSLDIDIETEEEKEVGEDLYKETSDSNVDDKKVDKKETA